MMNIQPFIDWQEAGKRRRFTIEKGDAFGNKEIKIWVYDFGIMVGQYVKSVDEIDLMATVKKDIAENIERLKKIEEA